MARGHELQKYGKAKGPRRFFGIAREGLNLKKRLIALAKAGYTDKEIGNILGVHQRTASKQRRHFRIFRGAPLPKNIENKILELRNRGFTNSRIAKRLGLTVRKVKRAGGTFVPRSSYTKRKVPKALGLLPSSPKKKKIPRDQLLRAIMQGLSDKELGKKFGAAPRTIAGIRRTEFRIKRRGKHRPLTGRWNAK